jgi:hypothetical protein
LKVLSYGRRRSRKEIPALDKNHLIAAIPADLAAKLNAGAQEGGPLRHPFLLVFLGFLIKGPLFPPDDMFAQDALQDKAAGQIDEWLARKVGKH